MGSYLELLRENSNYRNLWWASVISQFGDWFNLIASAALIGELTSAGTAISYLFLARFLPLFFFSPFAGVLADRYDRRYLMIVSDVLRAIIVLGFLLVREPEHVWLLYALTVLQFALSALFTPARSAMIANVVATEELVTANALDSLTWSTMLALGAFIGGVVASLLGIQAAFLLDAATFILSAVFVSRISRPLRVHEAEETLDSERRGARGWLDFLDGLRYLRGEPFILAISLVKGAGSITWGAINVLEITYATRIFPIGEGGSTTLGIIYATAGLGTGLGPLLLRRRLGDAPVRLRRAITLGFILMVMGIFILSVAQNLPALVLGTVVRTVGTGTIWVFSAALLQMLVPDRFRGRVFAFEFGFLTLTQSISTYWAGFAQDNLGLDARQVTLIMSGVGIVMGLLWLFAHLRGRHPIYKRPKAVP